MKKRKGLVYIGFGLFTVGVWFFPFYFMSYEFEFWPLVRTVPEVLASALQGVLYASLRTPWTFVAVVGLVLIGMGIYRLVCSLRERRSRQ